MSFRGAETAEPEAGKATVTAVIVNWNGFADTIKCMEALQGVERPACDLSIVVTDNASLDGSVAAISNSLQRQGYVSAQIAIPPQQAARVSRASKHVSPGPDLPNVTLISSTENFGFAGGNNIGVELSRQDRASDYFWLLNSDTQVDRHALVPLLEKMSRHPRIGVCGSTLLHASDRRTVQAYGGARYSLRTGRAWSAGAGSLFDAAVSDEWAEQRINYVEGAAMFVRAEFLSEIGLMCEDYFLYNEEIDLLHRSRGKFDLGVATKSIVYHKVGASIGTESASQAASRLSTFYQTRSKLLFAARHSPLFFPTVWLALLARGTKYFLSSPNRANAKVIFEVLAGRRAVDPRWFSERHRDAGTLPQAEV